MKMKNWICILILLAAPPTFAQGNVQKISNWLVLGPAEIIANGAALPTGEDAALEYDFLSVALLRPQAGMRAQWSTQRQLIWQPGAARFSGAAGKQAVYLAVYLESQRWLQTDLAIEAAFPVRVYLDGALLSQTASGGKEAGQKNFQLTLANGKHLLLVKGILPPQKDTTSTAAAGADKNHALQASLKNKTAFAADPIAVSLGAERRTSMEDVLNTVNIDDVFLAPDGSKVAVALSKRQCGENENRRWLEILDTGNGGRIFSSQGLGNIANFQWLKNSRSFSFGREEKILPTCAFMTSMPTPAGPSWPGSRTFPRAGGLKTAGSWYMPPRMNLKKTRHSVMSRKSTTVRASRNDARR